MKLTARRGQYLESMVKEQQEREQKNSAEEKKEKG